MVQEKEIHTIKSTPNSLLTFRSWIIWGCAAIYYLYKMILQVSPSVMTSELMTEFMVTSTALGVLASLYHYAYVVLQIPGGLIVDHFGPRIVVSVSVFLCAIGAYVFASSETLLMAQLGRFLIGAGSACAFLSCLKIASNWFLPAQFALLTGLTNMMGTFGGTFGGRPLAIVVSEYGWRDVMLYLGLAGFVIAALSWLVIRNKPGKQESRTIKAPAAEHEPFTKGLRVLAYNPQSWLIALYGCFMYLPITAFTELWAVPFLKAKYGIDTVLASTASVMLFVGVGVGSPLMVWLSDKLQSRLKSMWIGAVGVTVIFVAMITIDDISWNMMFVLLFLAGVFTGAQVICFACVKESNPNRISGTSVGFTNAVVMLSGAAFQPFMGLILDLVWDGQRLANGEPIYSLYSYQVSIAAVPFCCFLAGVCLLFIRETYGNKGHLPHGKKARSFYKK